MPRFTGRQYPGAMKDHRAAKRAEAEARQSGTHARAVDGLNAFAALGTAIAAPFQALADAFRAAFKAVAGFREQTQDDFALVPDGSPAFVLPVEQHYYRGGYTGTGQPQDQPHGRVHDGMLLMPVTRISDIPEAILTREEWAEVRRLAKESGAGE